MTHMRYWAMTLGVAISGAFIAIVRFAFAPGAAGWIAFGVAIGAAVLALGATGVALLRQNHAFSGASALSALIAIWTILATRTFTGPSALWIAFAGGVALLLVSLRALGQHETTIERVVHALEIDGSGEETRIAAGTTDPRPLAVSRAARLRGGIDAEMHSWLYWLAHTGIAVAGAFVVLITFAWSMSAPQVSVRWIAFGIGIAVTSVALAALLDRALAPAIGSRGERAAFARMSAIALTLLSAAVGVALIVTMIVLSGVDARWTAFALGDGLVGFSLAAMLIHELSSERVRHELEVAHAQPVTVGERTPAEMGAA